MMPICSAAQIKSKPKSSRVLDFTFFILGTFGFAEFEVYLSTKPEKSVGSDENWTLATNAFEAALKGRGVAYQVDPGEGVFYGPKIDIKIKDVLGRSWQCSTIQVDFNNPERFELAYTGEDGKVPSADHDSSCTHGFDRTFLWHSHRTLRRGFSVVAGPRASGRAHDHGQAT